MPPTTSVLDDFNRADGGVGADWADGIFGAGLTIVGNKVQSASAAGRGSVYTAVDFGADPADEAFVTITDFGTDGMVALYLGVPGSLDDWTHNGFCYSGGTGWSIDANGGSGDGGSTPFVPEAVWLRHGGTSLAMYGFDGVDWVLFGSISDYHSPGGFLALYVEGGTTATSADDFGGGTITADPFPPSPGSGLALGGAHPAFQPDPSDPFGVMG